MTAIRKRIFAIYLPQFHPIPENDLFWGKGFTEWQNVTSAKPLFEGHHQPQLPTELGFYDLRVAETMEDQCKLASEYKIDGFMFYHYWFNGQPVMHKPLENYLSLKQKLPYFFCWANENWTRRWDGGDTEILLKQDYSTSECRKQFSYLSKFFNDENYVKVNGCPVISIYKPFLVDLLSSWVQQLREICRENNLKGIYLIYTIHQGIEHQVNIMEKGFDAGMIFEPSYADMDISAHKLNYFDKFGKALFLLKLRKKLPLVYLHNRLDYLKYVNYRISHDQVYNFKCYPSVFPGWDNSSRRKNGGGNIFVNSLPAYFKKWLKHCISRFIPYSDDENFIIVNAWNEWAEGNHLEPCNKWGRQYLEAVKEAVEEK
jgi:lipopolysaccharide biosynthesis protein